MTIEVEGPGGVIVEFPDGTDTATMSKAMRDHFGGPPPDAPVAPPAKSGGIADVAMSAGSGLVRGATEALMAPVTLPKMAADAIVGSGDWLARKLLGYGPAAPQPDTPAGPLHDLVQATDPMSAVGAVRSAEDATLHKPETTWGRYAETIGEFAPSAVAGPGGVLRKAAQTFVPAVASETAGEATAGTAAEPYARLIAGLLGNAGTAIPQVRAGVADNAVRRAVGDTDPAVFQTAQQNADRYSTIGTPATGPEVIQQATQGGTKLGDLMRIVEGTSGGGNITDQFFARRPDQFAGATGRVLDQIAPQSAAPSTLGPAAAEAAQGGIDEVRRGINRATAPSYNAAAPHTLAEQDFAPIADDPAFQASLARLRSDPVLGPRYADAPDNSVGVIDTVTKDMRDRGVALSNSANPGFSAQTAGMYGEGAAEARDIARDPARGGSQAYDDALRAQEQARRQNLNPLEQGPLGRVAAATDTRGAYDALLPAQPLVGSSRETADAAARIDQQNPDVLAPLIRQHLADAADQARIANQGGPNQAVGPKFNKAVVGTPQQADNLRAALGATGQTTDLPTLLQAFDAQRYRKAQGSATAFNREGQGLLSEAPLSIEAAKAAATGGLSLAPLIAKAKDASERAWLGRNAATLADLFTAPDSAQQIAAIVARDPSSPLLTMLGRQAAQTPVETR